MYLKMQEMYISANLVEFSDESKQEKTAEWQSYVNEAICFFNTKFWLI